MNKKIVYINSNIQNHEFIYTGITFNEFIEVFKKIIKNMILLKAEFIGNNYINNFELVEGEEYIDLLKKENIHNYGDFCFVDYIQRDSVKHLTDKQIAELLYMAHMYKPLRSPFFDVLDNRFAYLAHDDGFVCKLYCRDLNDFSGIIDGKIVSSIGEIMKKTISHLDNNIQNELLKFSERGMLLDFGEVEGDADEFLIKIYSVGKYTDMNKIINENKKFKTDSSGHKYIQYKRGMWNLIDA